MIMFSGKEVSGLIIFVVAVLWIQQSVAGRPKGGLAGFPKEANDEEKKVYFCYRDILCKLGGEPLIKMTECYNKAGKQDIEWLANILEEMGHKCDANNIDDLIAYFCPLEEETKKQMFDVASKRYIDEATTTCSKFGIKDKDNCTRMQALLACIGNVIQEQKIADNCGDE